MSVDVWIHIYIYLSYWPPKPFWQVFLHTSLLIHSHKLKSAMVALHVNCWSTELKVAGKFPRTVATLDRGKMQQHPCAYVHVKEPRVVDINQETPTSSCGFGM